MDKDLYDYYIEKYGPMPLPSVGNNPYRIMFPPSSTNKIKGAYTYEKSDDAY
jgi:hypothetical protein